MKSFKKSRTCAACGKKVRPFPFKEGLWTGTMGEFLSRPRPKIEADHAFVCEKCGATICPVCSGKKASDMGVREFVCTECGYRPLKTIYRE